jgi:hypothetical protein
MSSESPRQKIPFEPNKKKTKPKKEPSSKIASKYSENSAYNPKNANLSAIPEGVSKRMIGRMIAFSGIPTGLGISSFFIFYWVVSHQWFKIPTIAVVLVTMGLFGLGVLGLSYGILSASWDEERKGSFWGLQEFRLNFGRMILAWKSARQEARGE